MTTPTPTSSLVPKMVRSEDDRTQSPRTRPAYTGGPRLKLNVFGRIEGYHLYWANDEDAAIEQLLQDGFEFATAEETKMQKANREVVVADKDVDSRVSKYVGVRADGSPLRAYLMKCENSLWQEIQDANQTQADTWDSAIREGQVENVPNRYKPVGYETKVTTGIR